jgi:predicted membrane-bound mannosyltransferase
MNENQIIGTGPQREAEAEESQATYLEWSGAALGRLWRWLREPEHALIVGIVLVGGILRFWDLGARALHHDESLHAYYSWFLAEHNAYQHNPLMHGTFQMVVISWIFRLLGDSDATARLLAAVCGTLAVAAPVVLLRQELGKWGAVIASALMAVSPAMLYFSRFARNDIYVVLVTLVFVWGMWRFMENPRGRYLYGAGAALALAFTMKEVAYLLLLIFMAYLFLFRVLPQAKTLLRTPLRSWPPAAAFLLAITTLVLPLGAASVGLFQNALGLNLANPDPSPAIVRGPGQVQYLEGPVGAPISQGPGIASRVFEGVADLLGVQLVGLSTLQDPSAGVLRLGGITLQALDIATLVTVGLFAAGAVVGLLWDRRRWLIAAAVFWGLFIFFFTTYFTNWIGVASGIWQSLGYWIAQQDVARGGQPWYYYPILLSVYEYLAVIVGLVSAVYFIRVRDQFGVFLAFWAVTAFLLFTYAGEKMPWLLVHLALPFILLAARGLGLLLEAALRSRRDASAPVSRTAVRWGGLGLAAVLLVLTTHASLRAAFTNGDMPVEMLVYTQTSHSVVDAVDDIDRLAAVTGDGQDMPITVDTMDGYAWPWYWYLRDYRQVEFRCLGSPGTCGADARPLSQDPADGRVVVLHAGNDIVSRPFLTSYGPGIGIPLRENFPETAYRGPNYAEGLELGEVLRGVNDLSTWQTMWTYWRTRYQPLPLGHADIIVFFPPDFEPEVQPRNPSQLSGDGRTPV